MYSITGQKTEEYYWEDIESMDDVKQTSGLLKRDEKFIMNGHIIIIHLKKTDML